MRRTNIVIIFVLLSLIVFILILLKNANKNVGNQCKNITNKVKPLDLASLTTDPNEFLLAYISLPLNYDYGSNLIPLTIAALSSPPGDFLELGMGLFSSPLLHKIARDQRRHVISVDTDLEWMMKFLTYNSTETHKLYHLPSKKALSQYGLDRKWSLVLVDHYHHDLRPLNVISFARQAQVVVAHDTEKQAEFFYLYERNKIREHFKYVCKFSLFRTANKSLYVSTTLLSNFIDLQAILTPVFRRVSTDFGLIPCDSSF